jgi:hypothetical protein
LSTKHEHHNFINDLNLATYSKTSIKHTKNLIVMAEAWSRVDKRARRSGSSEPPKRQRIDRDQAWYDAEYDRLTRTNSPITDTPPRNKIIKIEDDTDEEDMTFHSTTIERDMEMKGLEISDSRPTMLTSKGTYDPQRRQSVASQSPYSYQHHDNAEIGLTPQDKNRPDQHPAKRPKSKSKSHKSKSKDTEKLSVADNKSGSTIRAALQSFDFENLTSNSVQQLADKLSISQARVPLGRHSGIDYYFRFSGDTRLGKRVRQLEFSGLKGLPTSKTSTRLALVLGALVVSGRSIDSRWMVFLDKTQQLWALYRDETAADIKLRKALRDPYNKLEDKAFGTTFNNAAVQIGSLPNVPFKEGDVISSPLIVQLNWTIEKVFSSQSQTTPAPLPEPPACKAKVVPPKPQKKEAKLPKVSQPVPKKKKPDRAAQHATDPRTTLRFLSIDTPFLDIPSYHKIFPKVHGSDLPLSQFLHRVHFGRFRQDVDKASLKHGMVVGRLLMEAAWAKTIVGALQVL